MNVNNINNTNFMALKYVKFVPPTVGNELNKDTIRKMESFTDYNPPKRLKSMIEDSDFFKDLGSKTDVYLSSECYNAVSKNPFWLFVATFMDPYNKSKITTDEIVFLSHAKNQDKWFDILSDSIKKLPRRYELLKDRAIEKGFIFIGDKGHVIEGK